MKYYKNYAGSVVKAESKPSAGVWRDATEREYIAYRAYIAHMMSALDAAVAAKARVLGVSAS